MSKFKTRQDVWDKVETEGLDCFLLHYASARMMPDAETRVAFDKAESALREFIALLPGPEGGIE